MFTSAHALALLPMLIRHAAAQEVGDYLNLSFSGDGESPTALEQFSAAAGRSAAAVGGSASVSSTGDASYAIPIGLPPARLAPSVSLSYSSAGGHGRVGRGWSLDVGPTVRRPTGPDASLYPSDRDVHLVSGDGLSGTIWRWAPGGEWGWASDQPGAVAVDYDDGTRTFTITRDDTTWTLKPRQDVTWGGGLEPDEWHVVRKEDTSGNRVNWAWEESTSGLGDRIESISFGGATGVAHFLRVRFEWRETPYLQWSASGGVVSDHRNRLADIVVESAYGHPFTPGREMHLTYDGIDELLVGVEEREAGGAWRDIASFEYNDELDDAAEPSIGLPTALGYQASSTGTRGTGSTTSDVVFTDSSGDGLPDLLSRWASGRMRQEVSGGMIGSLEEAFDRWWEDPSDLGDRHAFDTQVARFDESRTVVLDAQVAPNGPEDLVRGTYATTRMLDLDGDGLSDLVSSGYAPAAWSPNYAGDPRTDNEALVATDWSVSYGVTDGWDSGWSELAPVQFPRAFTRPDLPEVGGFPTWPITFEDATVDLADIDGDGWQDVVRVELGAMSWFRKIPARGAGWEATPRPVTLLDGAQPMQVHSVQQSIGHVEIELESELYQPADLMDLKVPKIEFMEATSGLRDINGDGIVDFVSSAWWTDSSKFWDVWRGTGDGFEPNAVRWPAPVGWLTQTDEGNPYGRACGISPQALEPLILDDIPEIQYGGATSQRPPDAPSSCSGSSVQVGTRPSAVLGGLLDLDGDGRQDLVNGQEGVWYRNLGDGFSTAATLPTWMPTAYVGNDRVQSHVLGLTWTSSLVTWVSAPQGTNPADVQSNANSSVSETLVHVGDVDRDGLPDVIDLRTDSASARYSGRTLGQAERPGLLVRVLEGAGAELWLDYRSSATLPEIGQDFNVYAPLRKDLVSRIQVSDPVTGWSGVRRFDQFDPVQITSEEGGGVRFAGFGRTEEEEWARERYVLFGLPIPPQFPPVPQTPEVMLGWTQTQWLVDRDHLLPLQRTVSTDANASWVPGRDHLLFDEHARQMTSWSYHTPLLLGPGGASWVAEPKWSDVITTTECGEDRVTTSPGGPCRTSFTDVDYDTVGNVVEQSHEAPLAPADSVKVDLTWDDVASSGSALWRPDTIKTWSVDPDTLSLELVESGSLAHDALGRLKVQTVCVSTTCTTDPLVWGFDRTPRGAVSAVHAPLGRDTTKTWGFGETMVRVESRELGHTTQQDPDDLGRVSVTTDPNGVVRTTTFDGYGRPVQTSLQGAGAATTYVLTDTLWHDTVVPRYSETVHHPYRPDDVGGVEQLPDVVSYEIYDGLGRVIQTWQPAADGGWVVSETERDVRGLVRLVTEPHVEAAPFSGTYVRGPELSGSALRSWSFVDLFGDEILRWDADHETWDVGTAAPADLGLTRLDWPKAGQRRTMRGEHVRLEATDTLGRLVEVKEGRSLYAVGIVTGTYVWDGRDRVVRFTDGVGASWDYDLDFAGRTRQVRRRANATAGWQDYVGYGWTGPDPQAMWEGSAGSGVLAAEWTYDQLGRTTQKWVRDVVNGRGGVTTRWWWDQPPSPLTGPSWKGVRHATQDAAGGVVYRYEPGVFGGLGHVSSITRAWLPATRGTPATTATFERSYDLDGRVVQETWPSGRKVASEWTPSGHLDQQVVTDPGQGSTFTSVVSYDPWYGMADGYELNGVAGAHDARLRQRTVRNTSTQVAYIDWTLRVDVPPAPEERFVQYGWGDGLLRLKSYTGGEPLSYTYDHLRRIAGVWDGNVYAGPATVLERFEQDTVGNPVETAFADAPDHYEYAETTRFNQVPSRELVDVSGTTLSTDDFRYDGMSRLKKWTTSTPGPPRSSEIRQYAYDGAGRLRRVRTDNNADVVYTYDVDDAIVLEKRPGGVEIRRFGGWREEVTGGGPADVTEQILPMLRLKGGDATFALLEPDGHAIFTSTWGVGSASLSQVTTDVLGAYGRDLAGRSTERPPGTSPWPLDGFHGAEPDAGGEIVHFGARHMLTRDGLWMQPEPLLYLGLTNGDLANPRGFGGLYAMGNSNSFMDLSGFIPITEKGLKENPSPETLELSPENLAGLVSLNDGTVARQNDPQDPAVAQNLKPENSQQLVIPADGGEAKFVGEVDTTGFSGGPPAGGGNNGHGHGSGAVVGPSMSSNPQFAGRGNDQTTATTVAGNSSQGIGLVETANAKSNGITNKTGAVLAVNTSGGIVVTRYLSQGDNMAVLVRKESFTIPAPSPP